METYICKYCGKEFSNCYQLGGHQVQCKENPNHDKSVNQLNQARKNINKKNKHLHCKYCNKEVANAGCLSLHERHCKENPNRIQGKGNHHKTIGIPCSYKGETKLTNEHLRKQGETYSKHYKEGKFKLGTKHTLETKKKLREIFIKKVEEQKGKFKCFYAKRACEFINKLNEQYTWNLQHAENGGEVEIDGYFLDGYDKKLNIAFEYDEPKHYKDVLNNILSDKDIERQNYIINKLNCKLYRYNEYLNYFYNVN